MTTEQNNGDNVVRVDFGRKSATPPAKKARTKA